jgi:hypothetical protein
MRLVLGIPALGREEIGGPAMMRNHTCAALCALIVCLALPAGGVLASSVVPLELHGMVEAYAAGDMASQTGWDYAFDHGEAIGEGGETFFIRTAEIALLNSEEGSSVSGYTYAEAGPGQWAYADVATVGDASLVIGTSETIAAGTPLFLKIDAVEGFASSSWGDWRQSWELVLTRNDGQQLQVYTLWETGQTVVGVFAGETLAVGYEQHAEATGQSDRDSYRGLLLVITMSTSPVPEPSLIAVVGLGALGLVARRRR